GEASRRRALRSEFTDEEWRLVSELAGHPNRLLVTATPAEGETCVEVAHEAVFRRWDKLRGWIVAEGEFLAWRTAFEVAQRTWRATPDNLKNYALLMGLPLQQAKAWLASRAEDFTRPDRAFIAASIKHWGAIPLPRQKPWWGITLPRKQITVKPANRPTPKPRGSKVFISYRRLDTGQIAGRVYDRLEREFSKNE